MCQDNRNESDIVLALETLTYRWRKARIKKNHTGVTYDITEGCKVVRRQKETKLAIIPLFNHPFNSNAFVQVYR